jgi:hypothetical protein
MTTRTKTNKWPDGTPKSRGNAFDWRTGSALFAGKLQQNAVTSHTSRAKVAAGKITKIIIRRDQ